MIEVADVFRRFAAGYLAAHGAAMLPSHRRAIADILACRTEALGGQLWRCTDVRRRGASPTIPAATASCPKCHTAQTQAWLEQRQAEMLPVPYFHVTVTVPEELRDVLRANQRDGYGALMKAAAEAIIELARDPRYVGGTVGVLAVLHTWTQQLHFHPHVHCLVTGGGMSEDGDTWHPARQGFLVPTKALATLVRGRFRAAVRRSVPGADRSRRGLAQALGRPHHRLGRGRAGRARLSRPLRLPHRHHQPPHRRPRRRNRHLPIQRPEGRPDPDLPCPGHEFMRRFLQHVLPNGFHKVRYFGLWHPSRRSQATRVRHALRLDRPIGPPPSPEPQGAPDPQPSPEPGSGTPSLPPGRPCPRCRTGLLVVIARWTPMRPRAP